MFKIICLTTGSEIRWPRYWTKYHLLVKLVPREIQDDMIEPKTTNSEVMYFTSEEAASWFVRRRLSYNPKRSDTTKLNFMNSVFAASEMEDVHFSKKHQFEIVEV